MGRIFITWLFCLSSFPSLAFAQGGWEWYKTGVTDSVECIYDVAVDDQNGWVYGVGYWSGGSLDTALGSNFSNYGGELDGLVVKYDLAGNQIWGFPISNTGDQICTSVDVDPLGNVYVAGTFRNPLSLQGLGGTPVFLSNSFSTNAFVAKFDSNGNILWAGQVNGFGFCEGWGVSCDANGVCLPENIMD